MKVHFCPKCGGVGPADISRAAPQSVSQECPACGAAQLATLHSTDREQLRLLCRERGVLTPRFLRASAVD
jgi:ribosomal protein S27AE